ncbi:DUF4142 domain-containing protein [Microvirga sp. STR05]|uniref:DUF4142 domain-containing protein n=1 Tax=Hymenobacter duratus TaxID=2771356 RepID=A0ABR8JAN3_9BACT|nr:DUF4142 domain-containing protein [Hymenobacter duratus]MBD2713659.1 DUF4142 domain-containing protein [Hymenobacter duratus]MBR7948561.1 DUF4142 domain-containing protein [Microvirga sp. STR05]
MRFLLTSSFLLLATLLVACGTETNKDPVAEAKFQNEKRIGNEDVTSKQERDAAFVVNVMSYSMLDTEMSQMAQRKATSPDVKYLAQLIASEHAAMQKALQQLASQKSIVLPTGLGAEQAKRLGELGALNGPAFDRKYVELLEISHKTSIDEFDDMSDDAYDGDIRAFAANYLAPLKTHLDAAKDLSDKLPK